VVFTVITNWKLLVGPALAWKPAPALDRVWVS
jgi:hypothetical protein